MSNWIPDQRLVPLKSILKRGILQTRLLAENLQFRFRRRPSPAQAILLVGPARSGTSWLADILSTIPGTQQIFEPLLFNPQVYALARWQPPTTQKYLRLHYLRPHDDHPGWHSLFHAILTGRYRTYLTDRARMSLFPKRYLIKEIRANMMLGYIYDHFHPKLVYISRHPCAVVASRMRLQWHVDLDELLSQEELIEDHLSEWVGLIERAKHDHVASHAIWWAAESLVAAHDLASRPHFSLDYETLVHTPEESLRQVFTWLGLPTQRIAERKIKKNSRTTWRNSHADESRQVQQRLAGWKTRLSRKEQHVILDWAHRVGITQYHEELSSLTR